MTPIDNLRIQVRVGNLVLQYLYGEQWEERRRSDQVTREIEARKRKEKERTK